MSLFAPIVLLLICGNLKNGSKYKKNLLGIFWKRETERRREEERMFVLTND